MRTTPADRQVVLDAWEQAPAGTTYAAIAKSCGAPTESQRWRRDDEAFATRYAQLRVYHGRGKPTTSTVYEQPLEDRLEVLLGIIERRAAAGKPPKVLEACRQAHVAHQVVYASIKEGGCRFRPDFAERYAGALSAFIFRAEEHLEKLLLTPAGDLEAEKHDHRQANALLQSLRYYQGSRFVDERRHHHQVSGTIQHQGLIAAVAQVGDRFPELAGGGDVVDVEHYEVEVT